MSEGPIEFGVGNDRAALDELKTDYQETADLANISLEDFLAVLVAAYDSWVTVRLGAMASIARMEINASTASILVGLGVPESALFKPQDENEVDYLEDEALDGNGFDVA